jgi:hypothetical protein
MSGRQARREQPHQGLLADTPETHRCKDPMRNELLGGGRGILEAARVFHVTTNANTPGNSKNKTHALNG